jgi:hypothetical protein
MTLRIARKYIVFVLLLIHFQLFGQLEVPRYPVRFAQYYNNLSMTNPSLAGQNKDFEFSTGDKRLLGNLSKISTYYLNLNMRISSSRASMNAPYSAIGAFFYNDREGKYLNRTRFYLTYAWHGNITKNVKVSGGFRLGGMNYSVKGTPLSGDGSDFSSDGVIGFSVYSTWFYIGASYNQIFKSSIQPLEEVAILTPFYNISGGVNLKLSELFRIRALYSLQIPTLDEEKLSDATFVFVYHEKLEFVLGIHDNNRLVNSFGLKNIFNDERNLDINLTYGYPFRPVELNTNFIELGIKYSFNRRFY